MMRAKRFHNGRSQAVRLPASCRLSPQRQALVEALLAVLTIKSFDSQALSLGRALVSLNQAFEQVPGLELVSLQNR